MPTSWYQPAPFYVLRVPTLPIACFECLSQSGHLDPSTGQDFEIAWQQAQSECLALLHHLGERSHIERALLVASPSLNEALHAAHARNGDGNRRAIRAAERLMRYLIRMSSRPTPFGYCAGVSFGTFAHETRILLESCEEAEIRPDMHWLLTSLAPIEARSLQDLPIQITPSLHMLGKRGVGYKSGVDGRKERAWFKVTAVVEKLRQLARTPVPYQAVKHALLVAFPQATEAMVEALLHQLYAIEILLTTLPPPDESDPLTHVLDVLRPISAEASAVAQFESIRETMHSPAQTVPILASLIHQQCALTPHFSGPTLQVDTRVRMAQNELSSGIGHEAARAAETLLRLGLYAQGIPSLHHARRLFLERYEEQEVPLLDLFAPWGVLDGLYEQEMDRRELPQALQVRMAEREKFLRTLAMQAVNAREISIALTPELIERLSLWSPEAVPPPLLDLYLHIDAPSAEAVDHGEWRGLVMLLPIGGRSYCRFLHLFGGQERALVEGVLKAGERLYSEELCVTLALLPPHPRDLNITHGPQWSPYVLPINRASPRPAEQTIFPDDVSVSVRNGRFILRSRSHNKTLRVIQPHMLAFTHLPPLARFVLEASHDGEPYPGSFQLGNAGSLPFMPRLTVGNIVVSPAQWSLSYDVLDSQAAQATGASWYRAIQRWREQWNVPRFISLLDGEDRLLLDLEHVLMVEVLRTELASGEGKSLALQEAFSQPRPKDGWVRDRGGNAYAAEVVIPLVRNTEAPGPSPTPLPLPVVSQEERQFLPGEAWTTIKLYGPEGLQSALLAGPLASFIQEHRPLFEHWFFLRYRDPLPHIRLRFYSGKPQLRTALLQALFPWSHALRHEGYITRSVFDSYEREIERYGGPEAILAAESVFCANSEAACAILAQQQGDFELLLAAAYGLERLWADWHVDLSRRYHALRQVGLFGKEPQTVRQRRQEILTFLDRPPDSLVGIFNRHQETVDQASHTVRELAGQGKLWRAEEEILWSLSHLHCNRLLGTDRKREREVYAAWHIAQTSRYHRASQREMQ